MLYSPIRPVSFVAPTIDLGLLSGVSPTSRLKKGMGSASLLEPLGPLRRPPLLLALGRREHVLGRDH